VQSPELYEGEQDSKKLCRKTGTPIAQQLQGGLKKKTQAIHHCFVRAQDGWEAGRRHLEMLRQGAAGIGSMAERILAAWVRPEEIATNEDQAR
jgi:hypothetical protein